MPKGNLNNNLASTDSVIVCAFFSTVDTGLVIWLHQPYDSMGYAKSPIKNTGTLTSLIILVAQDSN